MMNVGNKVAGKKSQMKSQGEHVTEKKSQYNDNMYTCISGSYEEGAPCVKTSSRSISLNDDPCSRNICLWLSDV